MLLPRNTILSLSNNPITSPSAPLAAVAGVCGADSWKDRLGFGDSDPMFRLLEGIGEADTTRRGGVLMGLEKREREKEGFGAKEEM